MVKLKLTTLRNTLKSIAESSKRFVSEKGNVKEVLKLLANDMSNGSLLLDDMALEHLKQKYPKSRELNEVIILRGRKSVVHPVIFKDINVKIIKRLQLKLK